MDISAIAAGVSSGRLFHSYIITGSSPKGREDAAYKIAQTAVCSSKDRRPCGVCRDCAKVLKRIHPDITVIAREKDDKEIKIDPMRVVRAAAFTLPNEAEKSVYIISEADLMNNAAQNAMLKVFEEPPSHAVFILTAENPQRLLETVRSRCETLRLPPEDTVIPPEILKTAEDIVSAVISGDKLSVLRAVTPLEKADRAELPLIISALNKSAVRAAATGKLSPGALIHISKTASRADEMTAVNVSAGNIAGLFLAELL